MLEDLDAIIDRHWPLALQGNTTSIDICQRVVHLQAFILTNTVAPGDTAC